MLTVELTTKEWELGHKTVKDETKELDINVKPPRTLPK